MFNNLQNNKISNLPEIKAIAGDKFYISQMLAFLSETLWEKEKMMVASVFFIHGALERQNPQ